MRTTRSHLHATSARHSTLSAILLLICICIRRGVAFYSTTQLQLPSVSAAALTRRHSALTLLKRARYSSSIHSIHRATSIASSYSVSSTDDVQQSPRSKLRQLTGFSLTALRSTLRTATGFSLTTFRATLRAATGISLSELISVSLRRILGILSPSLRYFLQPLLVMYYAPLLMVRYWMVGPSKQYVEESRKGHEKLIDGWRKAVQAAERANSDEYWPVHLNGEYLFIYSTRRVSPIILRHSHSSSCIKCF
jgi:hypothetical protein